MRSNSFPFVLVPLRRSLCLFWRKTHKKGPRPEVEEGRKFWEKPERAVDKAEQKRTVG